MSLPNTFDSEPFTREELDAIWIGIGPIFKAGEQVPLAPPEAVESARRKVAAMRRALAVEDEVRRLP